VALRSSALTTVEAVRADITSASGLEGRTNQANVTDRLERLIEASSEEIRDFCNRNFERVENHQEFVATDGGRWIRVMHAPVDSVSSIVWVNRQDGTVIDTLDEWSFILNFSFRTAM